MFKMEYYVNYDPLRGEIIEYYTATTNFPDPFKINFYFLHFELDKVYQTNDTFSIERLDATGREVWYTIPVEKVQNKLRELIREEKLNDLLC